MYVCIYIYIYLYINNTNNDDNNNTNNNNVYIDSRPRPAQKRAGLSNPLGMEKLSDRSWVFHFFFQNYVDFFAFFF